MEETPSGTPVGVDDPYEHAEVCDYLTGEGTCRFAFDHFERDPGFARARSRDEFACPVASGEWEFADCPHFRSRSSERACARCGLEERLVAHDDDRPLLEEHHLSYPDGRTEHEITVTLCRWCHAKVHGSFARITDDANPDPEAVAEREGRRTRELDEFAFRSASERFQNEDP